MENYMVFAEHFNDYKEFIAKHQVIKESHKKYYITRVELFFKYLEQNSHSEACCFSNYSMST